MEEELAKGDSVDAEIATSGGEQGVVRKSNSSGESVDIPSGRYFQPAELRSFPLDVQHSLQLNELIECSTINTAMTTILNLCTNTSNRFSQFMPPEILRNCNIT